MSPPEDSKRLVSLDALRGFDMCWILGLAGVIEALLQQVLPGAALTRFVDYEFTHAEWEGFRFEDSIFPLFLFISGVSMAFAVPGRLAREGEIGVIKHLVVRAAIIFFLGVIYSGGMKNGWDQIRWLGVIQRIGVASAIAGILSIRLSTRSLIIVTAALLIGYYLMLALIPVPGVGAGNYAEGKNLTNYLDSIWLPGRKHNGDHDPEGILSTLPAIATALLGLLAGQWLRTDKPPITKVRGLLIVGLALFALGWAWHPAFPVVKKLWTSSFVLVSGGYSTIVLALFYYIVDIKLWRGWCPAFIWVGANPLTLYLMHGLRFFSIVNERLVGSPKGNWAWVGTVTAFALMILTARWMYRRGIFLRV